MIRCNTLMGLIVVATLFAIGCSKAETTDVDPQKKRNDVFMERQSLPTLFIGMQTGKQIESTGDKSFFLDKGSNELYWRAKICKNPRCKAPSTKSSPFLFITPDPGVYLKPDGSIGVDRARAMETAKKRPPIACPHCLKSRNLKRESRDQKEKYLSWVKPYILPETAKRIAELEANNNRGTKGKQE